MAGNVKDMPDFPNWEIPPKSPINRDSGMEQRLWLEDWEQRVKSGEITLEKLRARPAPVDSLFEI